MYKIISPFLHRIIISFSRRDFWTFFLSTKLYIKFFNNFEFFIILRNNRKWLKDASLNCGPHFLSDATVNNNVTRKKERLFRAIFCEISRICFDNDVSGVFYCIWLVGDSCFNSRAHMCCGQPVRPLLFVGSSWPRFEADCKHDSFCEEIKVLDDICPHQKLILSV